MKHFMRHFFRAMLRAEPKNILTSFDEANDETEQDCGNDGAGEFCEDEIPDFAIEASNVYRTKHFIVRQRLAYSNLQFNIYFEVIQYYLKYCQSCFRGNLELF